MTVPLMTVINYSGGKPSAMLIWRILLGEMPRPENLLVQNADPGMEDLRTYAYNLEIERRCRDQNIPYSRAKGPDLFKDLTQLTVNTKRIDNPPYWVVKEDGKIGRLLQKCTYAYKIAPMDRDLRRWLTHFHPSISRKTRRVPGIVERWIGFTKDEADRSSEPSQKFLRFRYPLIEEGISKEDVLNWYTARGISPPPRSMCTGCFAHGLESLRELHSRPGQWAKAVAIDETIRKALPGVDGTAYVSATCIPLTQLAKQNFVLSPEQVAHLKDKRQPDQETVFIMPKEGDMGKDQTEWSCDSGMCFI